MKLLLKLLLTLCVLIVGIYATTPWWMPLVLARQLPPGFQLDLFEASYPDVSGIHVQTLSVIGDISGYSVALSATDVLFSFREWKTDISSVTIDIDMQSVEPGTADSLNLDDLSLPVTKLTSYPPEVEVRKLKVILHGANEPLVLDFQAVILIHQTNNSYHLSSTVSTEGIPGLNGRLDADVSTTSAKANLRFPATASTPPWLDVSIEQTGPATKTTTRILALFDAGAMDRVWSDPILAQISDGYLNRIDGKLQMEALFTGHDLQHIEYLELTPRQLRAWSDQGSVNLDGKFMARRKNGQVTVTLTEPAEVQYEDDSGWIIDLFENIIPGLQLQRKEAALAHAVVDTNGEVIIRTGSALSLTYKGGASLDIVSSERHLDISTTKLQVDVKDFSGMDSITAKGLARLNWEEKGAFTYVANGLDVKADEMSISAEIVITDGMVLSDGIGTVTGGEITSMATSATGINLSWHQFDLLALSGDITARTDGFRTEFDDEVWSGFDFDVGFSLLGNSDIRGSGTIQIVPGPTIPIEFQGNAIAQRWNITLPSNSIKLAQLEGLLSVTHIELPAPMVFEDGSISLQGNILLDDGINANMSIKGHDMSGSLHESNAHNAAFSLDTSYIDAVHANGPVSIEVIDLAGGLEVTKIMADLNIKSTETFTLQNLSADLFDGQLTLGKLRFSNNRINDTTIELKHISLGQLLAFADIDSLEGTGFLALSLPTGSDDSGIYVKNGSFGSSGSGSLVYKKEGIAASNIGLQALENFQYQDLSGTIDYQSDGTYRIGIHLEGNNPDLYDGHPIKFNLNITGSLPELFEALFITGSFEETILKQIGIQ